MVSSVLKPPFLSFPTRRASKLTANNHFPLFHQVLDAALAIFLAILAKDARSIEQILRRKGEDCFVVVGKMLRSREDGFSLARSVEGGRPVKSKDRLAVNLVSRAVFFVVVDEDRRSLTSRRRFFR